jgi:hypothetical protein
MSLESESKIPGNPIVIMYNSIFLQVQKVCHILMCSWILCCMRYGYGY